MTHLGKNCHVSPWQELSCLTWARTVMSHLGKNCHVSPGQELSCLIRARTVMSHLGKSCHVSSGQELSCLIRARTVMFHLGKNVRAIVVCPTAHQYNTAGHRTRPTDLFLFMFLHDLSMT